MSFMKRMRDILLYMKGISGFIAIPDVCAFSRLWWDVHDYKTHKGGDGKPYHFYTYRCWHCGKAFRI